MRILHDYHRDRIDDDELDIAKSLDLLRKGAHILGRIEGAFSTVFADGLHEMDASAVHACGDETRNERIGGVILSAPDDDVALGRLRAIRPYAADGRCRRQREGERRLACAGLSGEELKLAFREPTVPQPVNWSRLDCLCRHQFDSRRL